MLGTRLELKANLKVDGTMIFSWISSSSNSLHSQVFKTAVLRCNRQV